MSIVYHVPSILQKAGQDNAPASPADCPAGGENPQGFHPFAEPIPVLVESTAAGRQNTVMRRLWLPRGRAKPPHDGILPAVTMPDWGEMNR
ncbi:MAG: hypothetical protein LBK61_01230 [Spirochaetaceae bacterium]|nr:hypothetical protein [Spirochaetaceae bacterium]